jgi:hypothetical protein
MMSGFKSYVLFLSILSYVSRIKWMGKGWIPYAITQGKRQIRKSRADEAHDNRTLRTQPVLFLP